jgi:hypothetical protein
MKAAPNYSIKFLRVVCLIGVIVFGLFTIIGTGGGSSDKNESTDSESITTGDFETTTIQEGNFGKTGKYAAEVFENALPAQKQLNQDNIPSVFEQHSHLLYVLDIQNWPSDWDIGSVIVVRMKGGRIEYKRLLAKFELSDGRLAIGAEEASALEVFEQMEINSDGNLTGFARSVRNVPRNIIDYDFERSKKVTIINETNMPLFNEDGVYLGFSEISLTINPTFKIHITIGKPSGILQIVGTIEDLKNSILDIVHGQLNELDNVIVEAGQVIVGIHLTQAENIMRLISSNENVIDFLGAIRAVLLDKTRLKEASVSLAGDITGTVRIEAEASGAYPITDKELPLLSPLLIPISGPIPIFLEFEPVGEARINFDAKANAEVGMTLTIPVSIRAEVINGELQPLEINNIKPEFSFPDEYMSFKEIKGGFTPSIGVQVECGLSLAKLFTVSIDPTASLVFDTDASVQGNDDQGCVDLNWDIYGKLSAEAEAELLSIWDVSWDIPFDIKVFDEVEPCGFYQYCWGGYCADNDGDGYYTHSVCGTALDCNDSDNDINPGAPEICDDGKDNDCDGEVDECCNKLPAATIRIPVDSSSYTEGDTITFTGFGDDIEDGNLTGSFLIWSSDKDGQIGTGASFTRDDLSVGRHTITLTATDSKEAIGTHSVTIIVKNEHIHQGWTMLNLPDTGQTQSYTEIFGEDSDYTINPPSYTDNGNGTVTDNVTGLIWQQEDDDTMRTWEKSCTYCTDLTLGGFSDWRLPFKKELMSIVDYGTYDPSIDKTYFTNTKPSCYWSYTTCAYNPWYVTFYCGFVANWELNDCYVRCVRAGK